MLSDMTNREKVESYIPMVKFIAAVCGPRFEVVLHCLDDLDHSIIAIENGNISGRKVGDGLRDYALESLYNKEYIQQDFIANMHGHSDNGRLMRFSTFYIKDDRGRLVGFIGVNTDITELENIRKFVESEMFFQHDLSSHYVPTAATLSASEMFDEAMVDTLRILGYTHGASIKKEDRIRVISILNDRNMFSLKGVIPIAAKRLGISEPSIYRYLNSIKNDQHK